MALPLPPKMPGLPLLGNALDLRRDPVAFFRRGYETLGPVFSVRLGPQPAAVVLGAEAHRFFFGETDGVLTTPEVYRFLVPMFGRVSFAAEPEVYREHRAILHPCFRAARMEGYVDAMGRETRAWLETLGAEGRFELTSALEHLSMWTAAAALLGREFRDRMGAEFRALYRDLAQGMEFILPPDLPIPRFRRRDRARVRLHALIRPLIAERRARPGLHADFAQALADAVDSRGGPLDEETLADLILLLVFSAFETTAAQAGWVLVQLLQHPPELARVREEVDAAFEDGKEVSPARLRGLERLGRAIREGERMRPVTTMLSRHTAREYTLGGFRIPRGWMTIVVPPVAHRLPELFRNPDVYDPDRFLTAPTEERALIGFGGGTHRCMGLHFARHETETVLGLLLLRYHLELEAPHPAADYSTGLTRPRAPLWVRYRRRAPPPARRPAATGKEAI